VELCCGILYNVSLMRIDGHKRMAMDGFVGTYVFLLTMKLKIIFTMYIAYIET